MLRPAATHISRYLPPDLTGRQAPSALVMTSCEFSAAHVLVFLLAFGVSARQGLGWDFSSQRLPFHFEVQHLAVTETPVKFLPGPHGTAAW